MNVEQFYPIFLECRNALIDSRNIGKGDVFFAFSGENFNAATQAEEAIKKGAAAVIIEDPTFENKDQNIFCVSSTLHFLQELSKYHRERLDIPIIGLTGSNGKTTTKELIHAVLSEKFKVQYTFGNLNNHIGVPLTLLSIKPEHEMAVIEMGANHQGEIKLLCELAQPTIGYITNFGKAHLEGFGGYEGVIKGKSELYDYLIENDRTILVNENDPIQKEKTAKYSKTITFGIPSSDYYFNLFSRHPYVGVEYGIERAQSKLTGDYNFTNICAAASLGFYFGLNFDEVEHAVEEYTPTNMRSQVVEKEEKILVLDTYNANPSSMAASLENFNHFSGSKTVILGDMLELGAESGVEHQRIFDLAKSLNFDQIITVGPHFKACNPQLAFADTKELADYLISYPLQTQNVLLKGSRGIALEKLLEQL